MSEQPTPDPSVGLVAEDIQLAVHDLDMRSDAELWGPGDRFEDLKELHQRAEAALGEQHTLTKTLFWETALSLTAIDRDRKPGDDAPRFPHIHVGLTQPEALDLLAQRTSSPSAAVRARVGDLLVESGGRERRRFALVAPAAMLELVQALEPVEDELEDARRTATIEDSLERGAELALSLNQPDTVAAFIDSAAAVLQQGVDLRRWHRVMCVLPVVTLLARRMTNTERACFDDLLQSAIPFFEEHPNASNPYLIGRVHEARRRLALAGGDDTEAASIDAAQADIWIRHAETVPGLTGAHFLRGALQLLERAGGQRDRVNAVKLRLREMNLAGIQREMKVMRWKIELPGGWVDQLRDAAAQPVDRLLRTLATATALRVTPAECEARRRVREAAAPMSALFPTTLMRSEAAAVPLDRPGAEIAQDARDLLQSTGWWLRIILCEMRSRDDLNHQDLLEQLRDSGNFREENLALIEIGLERAMAEDAVSALHILVPQLEDVLRAILPRVGLDTMVPGKDPGTTQEITLGQILPRLVERGVMAEDDRFLFSLVLEDPTGDNLRNDVAHGLIRLAGCTDDRVARVLQLFAIVASWALGDNDPSSNVSSNALS